MSSEPLFTTPDGRGFFFCDEPRCIRLHQVNDPDDFHFLVDGTRAEVPDA